MTYKYNREGKEVDNDKFNEMKNMEKLKNRK